MERRNVHSIVKHDIGRLDSRAIEAVIHSRCEDDNYAWYYIFEHRRESYADLLQTLYGQIGFVPTETRWRGRPDTGVLNG